MPAQKISISEKHSLKLLTDMEPKNISPQVYVERVKEMNNESSNSTIAEIATSQSGLNNGDEPSTKVTCMQWITVMILCFVNLINYMDRFTIAGNLKLFIYLNICLYFLIQ